MEYHENYLCVDVNNILSFPTYRFVAEIIDWLFLWINRLETGSTDQLVWNTDFAINDQTPFDNVVLIFNKRDQENLWF